MNLLLVEDNPGDVLLLRMALAEIDASDVRLTHVGRVSDAISRLDEERFDVVLLDLSLPDGLGLDTLFHVRDHSRDVPIVVFSGLADEAVALQAVQAGAQDYLIKGTDGGLLIRAVRYAIERQRMVAALRSQSLIDDLTGLYNRRGFVTLAEQQRELAHRRWTPLLLLFADLDGLKPINDTLGHLEGDRALIDTAELLRASVRASDIVARIGGDEFAVVGIVDRNDDVDQIANRILDRLDTRNGQNDRPYKLSLSIGIVCADPSDTSCIEDLLGEADARMYANKRIKRSA